MGSTQAADREAEHQDQAGSAAAPEAYPFGLSAVVMAALLLLTLATLILPGLQRVLPRQYQREAQLLLRHYYAAAQTQYLQNGRYDCAPCDFGVDFSPAHYWLVAGNSQQILAAPAGVGADAQAAPCTVRTSVQAQESANHFVAVVHGALGNSDLCDSWSINERAEVQHLTP